MNTIYLIWGSKIINCDINKLFDECNSEIDGAPNKRFDILFDNFAPNPAPIAGKIIAKLEYNDDQALEISHTEFEYDEDVVNAVIAQFGHDLDFKVYILST